MLARNLTHRGIQLLAPHSTTHMAARLIRGDNIAWLPVANRDRTSGKNTSEEDELKWISYATWQ